MTEGEAGKQRSLLRDIGALPLSTVRASRGFIPLLRLLGNEEDVTRDQIHHAIDEAFKGLYEHPVIGQAERVTRVLRKRRLIPNEQSTEDLIRYLVEQVVARSPIPIPDMLVAEFWGFFNELFASPELKGLGSLTLDMARLVLTNYEPLLVEIINLLKAGRRFNQWQMKELLKRGAQLRRDAAIVRRQIRAIRYIKPFFQADPKDFAAQARIVAAMVREFGPFFIKLAQVAAANADFLPTEIARELAVFHEDVPPMSPDEVEAAFLECFGQPASDRYLGFDASKPIKSGSIGSIYLAKKPFEEDGREILRPVIIKVGRHNLDREFAVGKLVLGLAIMSSQYWAPHGKLAPFLRAMQEQVDEFVAGFVAELDFEAEADNQRRFKERSLAARQWSVPELYGSSPRVLEMEYLARAESLQNAVRHRRGRDLRRFQSVISGRLLHAVLLQVLVFNELHGDMHPGNVMVDADNRLHLIDWGNVVPLEGKWEKVGRYLSGAVLADADMLTDALIEMSTQPEANGARRHEIRGLLADTLHKRGIERLRGLDALRELYGGGREGLRQRAQAVTQLMSNTQHAGLVLASDYLHLSRAVMALVGSFSSLYPEQRKQGMVMDLLTGLAKAPLSLGREVVANEWLLLRSRWRDVAPLSKKPVVDRPVAKTTSVTASTATPRLEAPA